MENKESFRVLDANLFKDDETWVRVFIYDDYEINMHSHDSYEMNIILQGKGVHFIENQSFTVKRGDVFVLPPNVLHGYVNNDGLKVYHIVIKQEFFRHFILDIKRFKGYTTLFEIEPFLRTTLDESFFLHLDNNEMIVFQNDLSRLFEYDNIKDEKSKLGLVHIKTLEIIAYLCYLIEKNNNLKLVQNEYVNSIIGVLEYIHANFSHKLTIEMLSAIAHMSRSTFLRQFNIVCKCNPIKYITDYRLHQAKILIKEQRLSKTQIALMCGFYDSSHLNKALMYKK